MRFLTATLLLLALLLATCPFVYADAFYLYARVDTSKFTWAGSGSGQWADSTNACSSTASRSCYLNTSSFTVTPTFGVAGGFYEVSVIHATGSNNVSSSLVTNCSVSSGGIGVTGDIYSPGYTSKWNSGVSACANGSTGIIKLNPSTTTSTLSFSYRSGTLSSSSRWDVEGLYFQQRTDVYSLSLSGANGTVTQSGPGYYLGGTSVTANAAPGSGYMFKEWRDGSNNLVSSSSSYTFSMPANNYSLNAIFVPSAQISVTCSPTSGGSATGAGTYAIGDTCSLTAFPAIGYAFTNWTSDQAGNNALSISNPYSFPVTGTATIYAQFSAILYNLTRSACPGGAVSGSSGQFTAGTQVTVNAIPDIGLGFNGWSINDCAGTMVSGSSTYTFAMPANDYDLHASFGVPEFIETFEDYTTGGASFDSLDKNDSLGPNQAVNGTGNPWWGSLAPNGRIDATRAHAGSKSLWGTAGGCKDLCNVQYRIGGGVPFAGNIYLDWWFYDPLGSGGSATDFCGDYTALSFYPGIPSNTDYPDPVPYPLGDSIQQLALGMSDDLSSGYDPTKYQARVQGDAGGYHNGWFNGSLTRSVGWHHARIIVGSRKSPSNTNDVTFFIDNMAAAIIGSRDSTTTTGYNIIELNTIMPAAGTCSSPNGCVYSTYFHYSSVDDINMSTLATPVTGAPSTGVGTSQITWNWTINALDGNGLTLWDSASAGSVKAALGTTATTFPETGLPANTSCSRFVESVTTRYCGVVNGYRSPLPPTCTLALPPVYGTSGDNAVRCGYGPGGNTVPLPAGLAATLFTAVRGFGSGPTKASKYKYLWNTSADDPTDWSGASQWTSGTLSKAAYTTGAYYLHLRACNADGLANPTSLTLGPYNYAVYTPVSKINDLWPLDNDLRYVLSPKTISAVWSDGFWIEETDRHAGIKVVWNGTPKFPVNNSVQVYGLLTTGDERTLVADYVVYNGDGTPIKPLMMIGRDAGGKGLNAATPAVTGGSGVYGVGLLVRMTGTAGDAGADFFYLDDDSGLLDGTIRGIKVLCGSLAPASSGSQVVTGVIGIAAGKPVVYATSIQAQ